MKMRVEYDLRHTAERLNVMVRERNEELKRGKICKQIESSSSRAYAHVKYIQCQ